MLNIEDFITKPKSMLIAPAGYGKTYSIGKCLKYIQDNQLGKHLILTHTHAGVDSIKEKIAKLDVSHTCFNVETITSFAQKYVLAFSQKELPKQEDKKKYYPFIIETANQIIKIKSVSKVISNTYDGLFVDEYQDCTLKQHELILTLSSILPTHILGDFLQGIFDFNEPIVDLTDQAIMGEFYDNKQELITPWRWRNGNNEVLGNQLALVRTLLISNNSIDLQQFNSIETFVSNDIYSDYRNYDMIFKLIKNEKSILIIDPVSVSIYSRINFIQRFLNIPILIESIDNEDFYKLSNAIDNLKSQNVLPTIKNICIELSNKTGIGIWFNEIGLKRKVKESDKELLKPLQSNFSELQKNISLPIVLDTITKIIKLPDVKCYRKELFSSLCKAIKESIIDNILVYDSMVKRRNNVRRVGRKIYGKCVGTTLLTKGLEFETVVILNAHKFKCPKHLYVAMTRASKRLIIFTNSIVLDPY
ncbi:MAG: AAA family ATPase [Bacteroidales bacterium]|jgi:DNA helicase-2/ATP-dependent DNA helicase PcrA|nr:AAA family ATPase [Bacteroidales bacterium]